ncbi:MAG TPA: HAD family hydrolase [Candidatus Angelobacter sp.]|nr:HAD family hydrolase [Candidatus Angelobacter sp.]
MTFTAKAILFDMDGVLIDSAPAVERVWRQWAHAHHLDPEKVVAQAHGRRSIETIRAVAPHMQAERENMKVEQMEIEDKEGVTALPGALPLLRRLPTERFAIVTSATRPLAIARLGYAGLPLPRYMVTADDVVQGKPSPEPYLSGAALLGVAPADCIVCEDTPPGIASAHAAGMRAIAVGNTYSTHQLAAADAVAGSLEEIAIEVLEHSLVLNVDTLRRRN